MWKNYFILHEIFDEHTPKVWVEELSFLIDFLKVYSEKVANDKKSEYDSKPKDFIDVLFLLKGCFYDCDKKEKSWSLYLVNQKRNITVNLRPIEKMIKTIREEGWDVFSIIGDYLTNDLLLEENVDDFKRCIRILKKLDKLFDSYSRQIT